MKNVFWLVLIGAMLLSAHSALSSDAMGGQLTYEGLGNNRYRVTCRYVRVCSSTSPAPSHLTLYCRVGTPSTSCSSTDARNLSATLVRTSISPGRLFCPSSPANVCVPNNPYPFNYETLDYSATVTLPPAPEWTLSVEAGIRPNLVNVTGNSPMRLEATLNNQLTLPNGQVQVHQNSSPRFVEEQLPAQFVAVNQRSTLLLTAREPDGDSTVCSLERPLTSCGVTPAYRVALTGGVMVEPNYPPSTPCYITVPPALRMYSPTFPVFSLMYSGSCPSKQAEPFVVFSPATGTLTLFPRRDSNIANDYTHLIVGQVTEYRLINGHYYKVGSVRRELPVIIAGTGNQVPPAPTAHLVTSNAGAAVFNGDSVAVTVPASFWPQPAYSEIDLRFRDPNPTDQLTVTMTMPLDPQFADLYYDAQNPTVGPLTLLNNGSSAPTLKIRLRPDPFLAGKSFGLPIRIEDNACPIKGVQNLILMIKIAPGRNVTATQGPARRQQLSAYPTPFTDEVRFALPRPRAAASQVLVFDQVGRLVDRLPVPASAAAEAPLTWTPAAHVPAGVYSARFADGFQTVRLVRINP